jgi:hypothetical protein
VRIKVFDAVGKGPVKALLKPDVGDRREALELLVAGDPGQLVHPGHARKCRGVLGVEGAAAAVLGDLGPSVLRTLCRLLAVQSELYSQV